MRASVFVMSCLLFAGCSGSDPAVLNSSTSEDLDPKYDDAFRVAAIEMTVATGVEDDGSIRTESLAKVAGDITTKVSKDETLRQFDQALALKDTQEPATAPASSGGLSLADYPVLASQKPLSLKTSAPLPLAVIAQNAPSAEAQTFIADALPDGADSAADFTDCSKTATRTVAAFARNFLGLKVAEVEYTLSYQYQCRHDGRGRYLANVRLFPSKVFVFWGFQLDFSVTKMLVTNVGTDDEPVAQMQLHSHLSLRSPLTFETQDQVVSVNGKSGAVTGN